MPYADPDAERIGAGGVCWISFWLEDLRLTGRCPARWTKKSYPNSRPGKVKAKLRMLP